MEQEIKAAAVPEAEQAASVQPEVPLEEVLSVGGVKSPYPPAEITVKMSQEFIFDMLLYHMYSRINGFMLNMVGLAIIIMGGLRYMFGQVSVGGALGFMAFGIAVLAATPLNLKLRAKNTMNLPKYQQPIRYRFSNAGIDEIMPDGVNRYGWELVEKAVNTPKTIAFYMQGNAEVLVFPKAAFDNETFRNTMWYLSHNVVMGKIYIH